MIEIRDAQKQVEQFLSVTTDARALSEKCRDYFDHKQWTEQQVEKLKARKQAPIVVNRVRPKVKGLIGLYNMRQSDPKAYPRTKKHEKSAHAITDALRYVADNNDFPTLKLSIAEAFFVEGYGGAIVEVKNKPSGESEIRINEIPWDRIYFDPHSRKKDFSDCRFKGFYLWLHREAAEEMFPDIDFDGILQAPGSSDETTEDRPRWVDQSSDRIRIAVHYFIHKGTWNFGVFTENEWLIEPQESPYLDDEGQPDCPIELVAANIDRDNNRYGEVAGFLDQQDEINHRRSKWLHLNTARQTHGRKGSVSDIPKLKRELAKPDGHIEWEGEEFGKDFGIIPTSQMEKVQVELYFDAKAELDATSYNAQLSGERQSGDLSGRAIEKLQAAGTVELNQDYNALAGWEKRIYRQIWARVKQFWTDEKWIRVTDDQDALRWVGLNGQLTAQQFLEEKINDESIPIPERQKAAAAYQFLMQNDPEKLQTVVGQTNPVAELDVDIIIDQSFDSINVQEEQFKMLAQFASSSDIDIVELIELSQIRGKEKLVEKIEKRRSDMMNQGGAQQQLEAMAQELENVKKQKVGEFELKQKEVAVKEFEAETHRLALENSSKTAEATTATSSVELAKIKLAEQQAADKTVIERRKIEIDADLEREKINTDAQVKIYGINVDAALKKMQQGQVDQSQQTAQPSSMKIDGLEQLAEAMKPDQETVNRMIEALSKPIVIQQGA